MAKGKKIKELKDAEYWMQKAQDAEVEIISLRQELDLSYKKHEEILDDMSHWHKQTIEAIKLGKQLTGEITTMDVEYNITTINRIIQHQHRFKSEE
jgi:hypothetical protein